MIPLADVPLLPEQASTFAPKVDLLFALMTAFSALLTLAIAGLILWFVIRYREGSNADRRMSHRHATAIEITWIVIPVFIALGMFAWGGTLFLDGNVAPKDALEITVVAKQWMWKFQHPEGPREINDLHLPLGRPVKLVMTSQDVIHSFFVPAFRIKKDVLPGRYTTIWFTPSRPGTYHLFCSQYCGTDHGLMRGHAIVMERGAYEQWLAGAAAEGGGTSPGAAVQAPAEGGRALFERLRCADCHLSDGKGVGPALEGLFGRSVALADGTSIVADENYLRDSILYPTAQVVKGYPPVMPTFEGQLDTQEISQLILYIKSLTGAPPAPTPAMPRSNR